MTLARLAALVLLLGALAGSLATASPTGAQDRAVVWDSYDVELTLRQDGSYHVVERQVVDFMGGPFREGFATIDTTNIEAIPLDGIAIREDGGDPADYQYVSPRSYDAEPYTFTVEERADAVEILWGMPPTTNQERTFVLEYDVFGALRVYEEFNNQQIWWTAIGSEVTSSAPVREASATIVLPRPVPLEEVRIGEEGEEGTDDPADYTDDGQTFTWRASDLDNGDELTIRLQFPPIVEAAPPSWQESDDTRRQDEEEEEERSALLNVLFLGIGLLSLVLGGAGVYGLWYSRGRDPETGLVADFLPRPPDDLPPGVAGALVDEVANEHDIIATVVDLGHRNVIRLDEVEKEGFLGFGGGRDFTITLLDPDASLSPFERQLVQVLFGRTLEKDAKVRLSDVKARFDTAQAGLREALYKELVSRGLFTSSPEATRSRWRSFGTTALAIIGFGGCYLLSNLSGVAPLVIIPIIVIGILALVVILIARFMPQKTQAGAEAAAKWRAFRRYLDDIEKYEKLDEARGIFEKYLPYAVAFGLEESWVRKFASVGAATPEWYGTPGLPGIPGTTVYPRTGRPYRRWGGPIIIDGGGWGAPSGGRGDTGGGGGFDFPGLPDLQDTSDSAGRSLQNTSQGLFDLFETAGRAFGGFGGGGRGGGWGGGGGGFRGGGFGGGSSGGGGRGFR